MKTKIAKRRRPASKKATPRARPVNSAAREYSLIVKTPGVCGGSARLIRTRIAVWMLEEMRIQGISEADILHTYPMLSAADLVQAWAYVDEHSDEIAREIQENEAE